MKKIGGALIAVISLIICLFFILISDKHSNPPREIFFSQLDKKEPGPDQRPSDWHWMRRTYPYWKADAVAYRNEINKALQMKSEARPTTLVEIDFAGPTNIGGRVSDIEFNPINPNIVYAGAATGGVFKSTDMGLSWYPIFDDQLNLNIGDIGIDPLHPDTLYVGTGEANGGHNNFPGGGIYKSTDGGETWQFKGLENTTSIGRIVVDPSNTQRIFVAAVGSYFSPNPERGLYISENGGDKWVLSKFVSDSTGAIDIVMDPNNPSRLIISMWERVRRPNSSHLYGPTSGIYRSIDSGSEWEYLGPANGLPDPTGTNIGRIGLAISQSNSDIVYALYTDGSNYYGLYKTINFGDNWSDADPDKEISNGTGGFSWYFGQVRVHPTNPDIVYAMDVSFMRSINSGATWPIIYGYGSAPADLHVDHHALAFHPTDPDYIIEGNDGGINISPDAGVTWSKVEDLPINQFYEIGLDYNNPQRLYGGTQDNGTLRTLTGALDDWERIWGGDGFYVIVDHNDPDIIYAESQFGNLVKTTTGGSSWSSATNGISGPTNWSTPVVMDPNNNQVLYYGTDRIFRTTNGASNWESISPDLTYGIEGTKLGTITTIAVAPTNSNIIWAGTDDSHVWVSIDYGLTWEDVSETLPNRWVTRVVPNPTNDSISCVTFSGLKWKDPQPHVFRTSNLGQSWTDISNNLPDVPINAFAIDPLNPNYLFVGTDLGAYYSDNTGSSWQYLSDNLPLVSIYDMKVHETANYLAIGTHGRSIYKLDLSLLTVTKPPKKGLIAKSFILKQNYPNPFNANTTISYSVPQTENISLIIYNNLGQKVKTLVQEYQYEGEYTISWDSRDDLRKIVPSGIYIYRLHAGNYVKSRKMILLK